MLAQHLTCNYAPVDKGGGSSSRAESARASPENFAVLEALRSRSNLILSLMTTLCRGGTAVWLVCPISITAISRLSKFSSPKSRSAQDPRKGSCWNLIRDPLRPPSLVSMHVSVHALRRWYLWSCVLPIATAVMMCISQHYVHPSPNIYAELA